MMFPLLSIIIPLYNNAHFITRCVNSIIAQNFRTDQPFEIIIINDGSTDNAIEVVTKLMKSIPQIRLINQENMGVSAARNRGIDEATGKYIYFIDPDDALVANYFTFFLDLLEQTNYKVLSFKYVHSNEQDLSSYLQKHIDKIPTYKIIEYDKFDLQQHIGIIKYIFCRRYILNSNIRFIRNLNIGEDTIWLNSLLCLNKTPIIMVDEIVYLYYQNDNSVMHSFEKNAEVSAFNYISIIDNYIKVIDNYPIGDTLSKYLMRIEIPQYIERYLNLFLSGLISLPYRELCKNIGIFNDKRFYPLHYEAPSFKSKVIKYVLNHKNSLYIISLINKYRKIICHKLLCLK